MAMRRAKEPRIPLASTWVLQHGKGRGTEYKVVAVMAAAPGAPVHIRLQCPADRRRTRTLLAEDMLSSGLYKRALDKRRTRG